MVHRYSFRAALAVLLVLSAAVLRGRHAPVPSEASVGQTSLQRDFHDAAREFRVPEVLLLAVSYNLTLWEDHDGRPSASGGYGPMHLTRVTRVLFEDAKGDLVTRRAPADPSLHTLDLAARLIHQPIRALERDPRQNVRGGAALLAHLAGTGPRPRSMSGWFGAVAAFNGWSDRATSRDFALRVYQTIQSGAQRLTADGQWLSLAPEHISLPARFSPDATIHSRERAVCPPVVVCRFIPAAYKVVDPSNPEDYGNYDVANRPANGLAIRYIIIHDTEGPYDSAISTFRNPARYASANYVIRSSDGLVTQMVPNNDIAWHAANYYVNTHAIGIEHEGIAVAGATWYSEPMYETSAQLVRYLALKYHIPLDRRHILGHDEVPGPSPATQSAQHWDPGPYWNWSLFMSLLGVPLPENAAPTVSSLPSIVTINPSFDANEPTVSYCPNGNCSLLPVQPANFLYLHTAPSSSAPLFGDPALHPFTIGGTTQANDWGDKAVAGQQFVVVQRHGSWDGIDYAGEVVWLRDPAGHPVTAPAYGMMVTPKGTAPVHVYGWAYPDRKEYPKFVRHPDPTIPLQYTLLPGQYYVASGRMQADFYWSPTMTKHAVVHGKVWYFQISLNHRMAYVRAPDVRVITVAPPATVTPLPTATAAPPASPGEGGGTPIPLPTVTVTGTAPTAPPATP